MSKAHHTYAWQQARKHRLATARANHEPCCRCSGEIDYTLHGNHKLGATIDHLVEPLALGGDLTPTPDMLAPAHRVCNSRHGARLARIKQNTTNKTKEKEKAIQNESRILLGSEAAPPSKVGFIYSADKRDKVLGINSSDDPYSPPRIITPEPPNSGSLAEEWVPWLESDGGPGIRLREWQKLVLHQALLVDSAGEFLYRDVIVSTPRQSGKGWLAFALAAMRCHFGGESWGPQTVLHIANNLAAARRIHTLSWRWAEESGLTVRRAMGNERVVWDDGSSWDITSVPAIWGASASVAIGDESWDLPLEVITSALQPTMVEREKSQLWLTSTANEAATELVPTYRRAALRGAPRTFIAEWSAPPDADIHDPVVWRAATPHWSEQRGELMRASQNTRGFRFQWLNMWGGESGAVSWLPGWDAAGRPAGRPPAGGVGALEVSSDRSVYGAAVAWRAGDGSVDVWTFSAGSVEVVARWLADRSPVVVLAGLSVREQVVVPVPVVGVGVRETRMATPLLVELVRSGRVRHDHGAAAAEQVGWARVTATEYGDVLSAKRSEGPISVVKAVCWAVWKAATSDLVEDSPEIW